MYHRLFKSFESQEYKLRYPLTLEVTKDGKFVFVRDRTTGNYGHGVDLPAALSDFEACLLDLYDCYVNDHDDNLTLDARQFKRLLAALIEEL